MNCPVCATPMRPTHRAWMFRCPSCGHWASNLTPEIHTLADKDALDQVTITEGLDALRRANYGRILDQLAALMPLKGKRLLDVGCSSGLFMDIASERGIDASGLEPDPTIVKRCLAQGKRVREGYFPDAIDPAERFDIISFNDVLEHIPDARAVLNACHRLLTPEGVLLVNLPNSQGIIYAIGRAADRVGVSKPLNRLWQLGFRSPHVHYFNSKGLARLAGEAGFDEAARIRLASIRVRGLWKRLRSDRSASLPFSMAVWSGVVLSAPFFALLPADITAHFFQPKR